jgi:universal stress protein E
MPSTSDPTVNFPRHVLCAIDLEGRAAPAVHAALWLAEHIGAELELVHAFPPRPILWGKAENMPEWTAGPEAAGRALRELLRGILAQAPFALRTSADALRLHITPGNPAHAILERARASHADLIVVGPHEKHGVFDLGNTARGVLAHASGGVWVQPSDARPVKRILVPADLSPASVHALEVARDLALRLSARVTALQAFEPPEFGSSELPEGPARVNYVVEHLQQTERRELDLALRAFDWRGVEHGVRFERGEPAEVIVAQEADQDLVIMGTHGRTGLAAAVLGSVTNAVLRRSRIPVLALRHAKGTFLI